MSARRWFWLKGIGCVALVLAITVWYCDGRGWLIYVPTTHDARLAGSWFTKGELSANHRMHFVMNSNGTGHIDNWGPIRWGTRNGVFYIKRRSAGEGWYGASAPYTPSPRGNTITFGGPRIFAIPRMLTR
jgi:hypothetical protein